MVAANVQGEVVDLWAGPLALAGGIEFRRDEIDVLHDPLSNQFAYFQNFGADYNGTVESHRRRISKPSCRCCGMRRRRSSLDLNVAGRHARYDLEGFGSYLRTTT